MRLLIVDNREQINIVRTPPRRPFIRVDGGVPEWLKGTGCKPVGYAYVGSNPTPSTIQFGELIPRHRRGPSAGVAQW